MFYNKTFIKTMSIIALVLFILVTLIGIMMTSTGLLAVGGFYIWEESSRDNSYPGDPARPWLVLYGAVASGLFVFLAVIGIGFVIASFIIYLPALIAWIVYKSKENVVAYWILMGIWLAFILIGPGIILFG